MVVIFYRHLGMCCFVAVKTVEIPGVCYRICVLFVLQQGLTELCMVLALLLFSLW